MKYFFALFLLIAAPYTVTPGESRFGPEWTVTCTNGISGAWFIFPPDNQAREFCAYWDAAHKEKENGCPTGKVCI